MQLTKQYQANRFFRRDVIENWENLPIAPSFIFSHRSTQYTAATFPFGLHFHDYAELVFTVRGDVRYLCEDAARVMQPWDAVFIPGGRMHASIPLREETRYERYVLYFYPDAPDAFGGHALGEEMFSLSSPFITLTPTAQKEVQALLERAETVLHDGTDAARACAGGIALQLFYLLVRASGSQSAKEEVWLPESMQRIRRYVDENYASVSSVSEISARFYYSREYVSRLFRQYMGTSAADYIRKRRVSAAAQFISEGVPLTEVCFRTGFGSVSAFIRAFREETGMTPSEYRKSREKPPNVPT